MSNIIVEGFSTYGTGPANSESAVGLAMLSGVYASGASGLSNYAITQLPWDVDNLDLYLRADMSTPLPYDKWRRVLPTPVDELILSFYYAVSNLPDRPGVGGIFDIRTKDNSVFCRLMVTTTGSLAVVNTSLQVLASTSGPVIVAQSAVHVECRIKISTGEFQVYVSEKRVINASGLAFSQSAQIEQLGIAVSTYDGSFLAYQYIGHLIVRDTAGTTNNSIMGDRKVATLFVDNDDTAHQGWVGHPLKRFGRGILDMSDGDSLVYALSAASAKLTSGDFTLEGQFRFYKLPSGATRAVLFGKWDETDQNRRSYQLYLGGPDQEKGYLVFRTSTDGKNGTVVEKGKWDWKPDTGRWYHVALVRGDGVLTLYIDGVQYGGTFEDQQTYFDTPAYAAIGGQTHYDERVKDTHFQGWIDEFRLSNVARYSANFIPPTEGFPRGTNDPHWGSVLWLSSFDNASIADDGPLGILLDSSGSAAAVTPDDGEYNYQTMNTRAPKDANFIQASLIAAQGILTLTALPADGETVTVGVDTSNAAAVYTFKPAVSSAFQVLIGASITESMVNLTAAINKASGEGTTYGAGTLANASVTGHVNPSSQVVVTATTPGANGNHIPTSETLANGAWGGATLSGGYDIPPYSQFSFERMPSDTVIVDSITIASRQWRTAAGQAEVLNSLVGGAGGVLAGELVALANTPTVHFDTFEIDPDTKGSLTPSSVVAAKVRVNRKT